MPSATRCRVSPPLEAADGGRGRERERRFFLGDVFFGAFIAQLHKFPVCVGSTPAFPLRQQLPKLVLKNKINLSTSAPIRSNLLLKSLTASSPLLLAMLEGRTVFIFKAWAVEEDALLRRRFPCAPHGSTRPISALEPLGFGFETGFVRFQTI